MGDSRTTGRADHASHAMPKRFNHGVTVTFMG
jgi:hypothetical protein